MWIYGVNPVLSVIRKRPKAVREIVFTGSLNPSVAKEAESVRIRISEGKPEDIMARMGFKTRVNHQKIFASIEPPALAELDIITGKDGDNFLLMLDGVTDPHNLGALIRTASAFGVDAVIIPKDRNSGIDATVYKTSSGAVEEVDICSEVNLVRAVQNLKKNGYWVYGIEASASKDIGKADLKGKICCVLGGEDTGIRRLLAENCDEIFSIPMHKRAHSLNVSVAGAILMYEAQSQRL
ncbi:MAG: 23S rRNA (guanosine(2251)-2'-O)-methyltransferase RlmB [Oligoflexia bacterium]|nr:23S rRNA (guanosine(2251)-2'-O)-methyltransferase RlmB [Oligoflexia bacterium]